MISTLQDLCYQKIATTMQSAPPGLQEIIMGETAKCFKQTLEEQIKKDMSLDIIEQVTNDMMETVPVLVPEIMDDIIASMTNSFRMRQDFRIIYQHLSPYVVQCAILTAEHAVRNMEDKYFYSFFRQSEESYSMSDSCSLSDKDSDNDDHSIS